MLPRDLCSYTFKNGAGFRVETFFELPLTPTTDPRVWLYHSGRPTSLVPAIIRIEFREPPTGGCCVSGKVERVDYDLEVRSTWHHGVVVITDATQEP
jgi:hypothetical protein